MQDGTPALPARMVGAPGVPLMMRMIGTRTLFHFRLLILATLLTSGLLSGCVNGGEGTPEAEASGENTPPANDTPGGIWTGHITNQATGTSYQSIGLIDEKGVLRFITEGGGQTAGTVSVTGNTFTSADISTYAPLGFFTYSTPVDGTARGTINKRSALAGSTSVADTVTANFNFSYNPIYERDSSLSAISGNYSKSDGTGYTTTYSIDAAGVFTGSDTRGCVFNGNVELLNTDYNMYQLNIIVANCGEINGHYHGLAALIDHNTQGDTLLFSLECIHVLIAGAISRA